MKKAFLALAAVALLFATSCNNETNAPENITAGEGEFLATIDNGANTQNAPVVKDGMSTMTTIEPTAFSSGRLATRSQSTTFFTPQIRKVIL